jgi:GAF domain-containing protein
MDLLYVPLLIHEEPVGLLIVLGNAGTLNRDHLPLLEHVATTVSVAVENARLYGDLSAFAEELERSQNQLVQAEKMAAVGRLAASIAHEINNPLQAIQNSMHLAIHPNVDTTNANTTCRWHSRRWNVCPHCAPDVGFLPPGRQHHGTP